MSDQQSRIAAAVLDEWATVSFDLNGDEPLTVVHPSDLRLMAIAARHAFPADDRALMERVRGVLTWDLPVDDTASAIVALLRDEVRP